MAVSIRNIAKLAKHKLKTYKDGQDCKIITVGKGRDVIKRILVSILLITLICLK